MVIINHKWVPTSYQFMCATAAPGGHGLGFGVRLSEPRAAAERQTLHLRVPRGTTETGGDGGGGAGRGAWIEGYPVGYPGRVRATPGRSTVEVYHWPC